VLLQTGERAMDRKQVIVLALQASIFLTVFSFGLRARWTDVLSIVRQPGKLLRSLVSLFVVMPLVAVFLDRAFDLRQPVKIALAALAISPIPPIFPIQAGKAGGPRAFTLGLLETAALLSIVVVPLALELLQRVVDHPLSMTPWAVARLALITVLLPILAGMTFRSMASAVADRIARPIMIVAALLLGAGSLVILFVSMPAIKSLIGDGTLLAMAAFAAVGLLAGHLLGGPDPHERAVLALSSACRHPGIALAIATANYPAEQSAPAAVLLYVLVAAAVCFPYVSWQHRRVTAMASAG
jgi:BASS family bile acid:Na+ symporter